ncbi:MAG TPA: diaminobutyrate acetyltransferase [Polyangiales bacterium]|nr:diaminobutyrate acetyltransferase [Polyangiales bacterium]
MSTRTSAPCRSPFRAPLLRTPVLRDAARISELASRLHELDRYAGYLYLLLCDHFRESCAIAEDGGELVGFVTGYRKPAQPDTLFIWQVGTAPSARGRGVAGALLEQVLRQQPDVRYLETTVTADNQASRRLFAGLARRHGVPLCELTGYGAELFALSHQAEPLLRLGAFARRIS